MNPNVPWKTRGNAALSARFGLGLGPARTVGELPEGPIRAYDRSTRLPPATARALVTEGWHAVREASATGPRTDPAFVAVPDRLPASGYWEAVRGIVPIARSRALLREADAVVKTRGSARGLVGAAAAVAWPGRRATWELIAYRDGPGSAGPRPIDPKRLFEVEARFPELFASSDPRTRRILIAPHTRCPVLFGLRARTPDRLPQAMRMLWDGPTDRWVVYRTNQATGDHLVDRRGDDWRPYEPARFVGRVVRGPERLPGGHVRFLLGEAGGSTIPCLVFEPTKTLPIVAASLSVADRLKVWGGRGRDRTLRVEGFEILSAPPRPEPPARPRCASCDRTARSLGRARGFRCPTCRHRWPPEAALPRTRPAEFGRGTYHPTLSARRHLHPLVPSPPARPSSPL
ncbi:MAG TPA: DUF1743 domain-containing protein [Thermoplasmata archaeon]|nr:DUF1743 domain-containing protein [Thermoplasmata archaeon]